MAISLAVILACVFIFHLFQNQLRVISYAVFSPAQKAVWSAGGSTSGFFGPLVNAWNANHEVQTLTQKNHELLAQVSSLREALGQQAAQKTVAEKTANDQFALLSAEITGLDAANGFMLVGKGSADRVAENMPVISSQKVMVGRVFKVYRNFSQVMLISNKESTIDVKIQHDDAATAITHGAVKGGGNLSFYLDLVPTEATLQQGDVLVTSALEGISPKDLLVGTVSSVDQNDLHPFQTAKIQPFLDMNSLDDVFIITDYQRQ